MKPILKNCRLKVYWMEVGKGTYITVLVMTFSHLKRTRTSKEVGVQSMEKCFVLIVRWLISLLVEQTGADQCLRDSIGVAVGRWATVLKVTLLLLANSARNADAGATVGYASGELVDVGGLVVAGQTADVVQASLGIVGPDVVVVSLAKLLDGILDFLQTAFVPHLLGAEVGVAASTIPVPRDWLGVK